jgi:hypothetical protein
MPANTDLQQFRVHLSGSNVLMDVDGGRSRYGFEVVRFVEAKDATDAGAAALDLVLLSPQLLKGARNDRNDPIVCNVANARLLAPGETPPPTQPGFAFYREEV